MKEPIKPGTEKSGESEGGSLGNIDEQTGHPGKGTSGSSLKSEESGSNADRKPESDDGCGPGPTDHRAADEEKDLYGRLAAKDAEPAE